MKAIYKAIDEHELNIKPKVVDQIRFQIKSGHCLRQKLFIINGALPPFKKDDLIAFKKKAREILEGINLQTVPFQVQNNLGPGDDYLKIFNVLEIHNEDKPVDIIHKKG